QQKKPPSPYVVAFVLILPVLLIFSASIANAGHTPGTSALNFLGHPFTALMIATLVAMIALGAARGLNRGDIARIATDSLGPIGGLLVIMGGGGPFKQVIVDSGVGVRVRAGAGGAGAVPVIRVQEADGLVATGTRSTQRSDSIRWQLREPLLHLFRQDRVEIVARTAEPVSYLVRRGSREHMSRR